MTECNFVESISYLLCRLVIIKYKLWNSMSTRSVKELLWFLTQRTALLIYPTWFTTNKYGILDKWLLALVKALIARASKASSTSAGSICKFTTQCKIQRIVWHCSWWVKRNSSSLEEIFSRKTFNFPFLLIAVQISDCAFLYWNLQV